MRLTELDPKWFRLDEGGPVVGLTFLCPHCKNTYLGVAFHHRGHEAMEDAYIRAHHPENPEQCIWTLDGQDNFETLTLDPSVDTSKSGHWHGFIKNGEIQ